MPVNANVKKRVAATILMIVRGVAVEAMRGILPCINNSPLGLVASNKTVPA
jgi:hypothetical protein